MPETTNSTIHTRCCIVGGGPAGIMAGFLLARAGVEVTVLEKHKDFFRDFRGDTIHPSTIQLMYELGILDEFEKVPHQEYKNLSIQYNEDRFILADFSKLPIVRPVIGIMPQWDFLNFISKQAAKYPAFKLMMEAEATDIIKEKDRVTGVIVKTSTGNITIKADLVIATDGRSSIIREKAKMNVISTGAPIDVLWFGLSRISNDPDQIFGRFDHGRVIVMIDRQDYWQCAYIIEKDGYELVKADGLDAFKKSLLEAIPYLHDRVDEIKSWDDIKLLSVTIDHLEKWYTNGLLCIGDAAHAMSPVGGVGINLAVQDAVATANLLYKSLKSNGVITENQLSLIQKRREFAVRVIQKFQVIIQKGIVVRRGENKKTSMPFVFRLIKAFPFLRRFPAKFVGMGVRPEHIETPDVLKSL